MDLPSSLDNFVIAKTADAVIGACGIEQYGTVALLRSLAVAADFQGKGLGNSLYQAVLEVAKDKGVKQIFLITTTAAAFFRKQGFTKVERSGSY